MKFAKIVEEAVATGGLEKVPLLVPSQHVPSEASDKTFLNFDERQTVAIAIDKLCKVPSPNLEELFKVSIESYVYTRYNIYSLYKFYFSCKGKEETFYKYISF